MGVLIASPQADATWRGVVCLRKMASVAWGLSTGILVAVPSVLSPEPPVTDFHQVSLVHSAIPLPEPRVSGYK